VLAVAVWVLARRWGASRDQRRALTWLCVLLAAQGVIGGVQYQLELPAEIVWVHVSLAATTWLAILWSVAAAPAQPSAVHPEDEQAPAVAAAPAQPSSVHPEDEQPTAVEISPAQPSPLHHPPPAPRLPHPQRCLSVAPVTLSLRRTGDRGRGVKRG
jgi:hypothetical protein